MHAVEVIKGKSKYNCQQNLDDHLINMNDEKKTELLSVKSDEKNISNSLVST